MRLREFTFACLLTAMVMGVEFLAATTGEALVVLTMTSSLPLYILGRENTLLAVMSYICIGLMLFFINPHQCLFFVTTNGLLGLALGVCDRKIKHGTVCVIISGLTLFGGCAAIAFGMGLLIHWWIVVVLLPFSLLYASIYRLLAGKLFVKWLAIKQHCQ